MDQDYDLEGAPLLEGDAPGYTVPDGRLSIAIYLEEAIDVLKFGPKARCKTHRYWVTLLEDQGVTKLTPEVCFDYHSCVGEWVSRYCLPSRQLDFLTIFQMSVETLNIYRDHQYKGQKPHHSTDISGYASLNALILLRFKVDYFKSWYRNKWQGEPMIYECAHPFIYDSTLSLFDCPTHGKSLTPTSLILSVLDSIQRRSSGLLFAAVCDVVEMFPGERYFPRLVELDHHIVQTRSLLGNNIYRILGAWYSLTVSTLITMPGDLNCTQLREEVLKGLRKHIPAIETTHLFRLLTTHPMTDQQIRVFFETQGMAKAYGHPIVDFAAGVATVREYACVDKGDDLTIAKELDRAFKSRLSMTYFRKHGKWPNLMLSPTAHPVLVRSVEQNVWPRDSILRELPESIFDDVTFLQTFEFDYHIEAFDLLGDKSCAPELPFWKTLYDPCAFDYHYGLRIPVGKPVERRVISRFLTSYPGRTTDVITAIEEGRAPSKDDIVVLVPKEGELKIEARPFALVTYDKRLHVGLIGKNVAKDISNLFTSQTVNDSEIRFLKKVSKYSLEASSNRSKVLYIVLDFKKFNLQFCLWLLLHVLISIQKLYGFNNAFVDAHAFYTRAFFLVNSRTRPPRPDSSGFPSPGPSCHVGHNGATEGMFQRIWSVVTSLMIEIAMRQYDMRGSIIGQGDNQVIVARLTVPQATNMSIYAQEFLNHLERSQDRYQVPINKTECWYSNRVYEANKELYVAGVQLSNGTKYAMKMASDANDSNNIFETRISSISTIAESVSKRMDNPDAAFLLGTIELIIQTYEHGLFGDDIQEYRVAPFWGTAIGGLPIAFYNQLIMRGHPDRLTMNLSIAKHLSIYDRRRFALLCKYSPMIFSQRPNPELLLTDCHALDFPRHLSVAAFMKNAVQTVIRSYATNPTVTSYFPLDYRQQTQQLVQKIISIRPFACHIAMELYRCSNVGIANQFLALFDSSRTLVRLTQKTNGGPLFEEIKVREQGYFGYLTRLRQAPDHNHRLRRLVEENTCMTKVADQLRLECWGFPLYGATVAAPMDQLYFRSCDEATEEEIAKSIIVTLSDTLLKEHLEVCIGVGPFSPYLGSKTVEKVVKNSFIEVSQTVANQATVRLYTIKSWLQRLGSPNLQEFVQTLIDEKNLDLSQAAPRVERGDIYHRVRTPLDSNGCIINSLLHKYSHIRFSTSGMSFYQEREADYTTFFQPTFLYIADFLVRASSDIRFPRNIACVLFCPDCTKETPNETLTIDGEELDPVALPTTLPFDKAFKDITTLAIAVNVTNSIRQVEISAVGDPTHVLEEDTTGPLTLINMADFRRCDFISLPIFVTVRSHYFMRWIRGSFRGIQSPVTPQYLIPVADLILRSGRLPEAVDVWKFKASYESSLRPSHLAKQLFIAWCYYVMENPHLTADLGRYHFLEEEKYFQLRYTQLIRSLKLPDSLVICIGDKIDLRIALPAEIKIHVPRKCIQVASKVIKDSSCVSPEDFQGQIERGEPIPAPLYHLSRGMGHGSSAASKYYMIVNSHLFPAYDFDLIVSLAEGCGSVLAMLLHKYGGSLGIFNTLMNEDILKLNEPTQFVPSALIGCGLERRILELGRSVMGETNIHKSDVQRKITSIADRSLRQKAVLLTMDAETTEEQDWDLNLRSSLNVLTKIISSIKVGIFKLIIDLSCSGDVESRVENLLTPLGFTWYWSKPISSHWRNLEVFLIVSNKRLHGVLTSAKRAFDLCETFSSQHQVQQFITLGLKLSSAIPCMNISEQNLTELMMMPLYQINRTSMFKRLIRIMGGKWEELEDDVAFLDYARRAGREEALLQIVLPIFLLYHFWAYGRGRVLELVTKLKQVALIVCHSQSATRKYEKWPVFTSYCIQLFPISDLGSASVWDQSRRVIKKVLRATLTLYQNDRPPIVYKLHPNLRYAD